jgi:hypothetical protein
VQFAASIGVGLAGGVVGTALLWLLLRRLRLGEVLGTTAQLATVIAVAAACDVIRDDTGLIAAIFMGLALAQCHLACFCQLCCLRFCEVDERDGGRGIVADAVVAGSFHAVGVVPAAFDDAGVGALAPLVEVAGGCDVGRDLFQGAAWLVRGGKPGRRPGGGRRGWCASA